MEIEPMTFHTLGIKCPTIEPWEYDMTHCLAIQKTPEPFFSINILVS